MKSTEQIQLTRADSSFICLYLGITGFKCDSADQRPTTSCFNEDSLWAEKRVTGVHSCELRVPGTLLKQAWPL